MNRITYESNYCDVALCSKEESSCSESGCLAKRMWDKLKAYEDTGLTAEEIRALLQEVRHDQ